MAAVHVVGNHRPALNVEPLRTRKRFALNKIDSAVASSQRHLECSHGRVLRNADIGHDPISCSFNSLHCLPALNGATCPLGNFPQCLTNKRARSSCLRPRTRRGPSREMLAAGSGGTELTGMTKHHVARLNEARFSYRPDAA